MKNRISERLKKMADFVSAGACVADIGTDHGLLPIYLRSTGIASHVILSDINPGPLEKAKKNLERYDYVTGYEIRLGDGLAALKPGEVDTVIIAGMGGKLISKILEADLELAGSLQRLIMQPRRDAFELRRWLISNGFEIVDEALVREGRYVCEIIVAVPFQGKFQKNEYDNDDFEFSPILIENKDPLFNELLKSKINIAQKALDTIENASSGNFLTEATEQRRYVLLKRIRKLQSLLINDHHNE